MSLNGVSNTVFPNTLNGLDSLNVTNITIDGKTLATLFVPYTGALSNVDLNNKSLTGINGLTAGAITSSGLIQGDNLTATSLTTTNTLKINSVPAGTAVKNLATDASGNVIEIDLTSKYVPYTGASTAVNLASQNLTNVNNLSSNTITCADLTSTDRLRISSVPSGTIAYNLAITAGGDVIQGSSTAVVTTFNGGGTGLTPSTATSGAITLGGVLNVANGGTGVSNSTGTGFVVLNVGSSLTNTTLTGNVTYTSPYATTPSFALGIDASNVICRFSPTNQIALTAVSTNTVFNLVFTNSTGATSNAILSIDNANNIQYNPSTDTFTVPNLTVGSSATIPGYAPLASPALTGVPTAPTAAPGTNTTQIATTAFVLTNASGYAPLASPALTGVPTAPTAAPGTNTTQIATCAFVLANAVAGSFLPLAGGTMTGSITFATTNTLPITLTSATGTSYTYSIRDTQWAHTFLQYITATTGTFPQLRTDVPIGIGTSYTPLMSLPYNAGISYSKTIQNTGGDTFITFGSSAPSLSLSAFTSFNVAAIANRTVGLFSVNGTSNDGVTMWMTSGGTQCGNLVLSDTYGTTLQTATPTTSWGRYFAVGGQVFQDFYGAFEWRGTTTLGATTWSSVQSVAKMSTAQMGFRMGSMFDFSVAGTWDNNNSLFVTTGGLGGTNNGVGIGYNTTIGTGLLVSIQPNVAWRPMRYKAEQHQFFVNGNVSQAGVNQYGLYAENAGYFTNYTGAINAGLGGVGSGDLVFYANSSGVHRFFSGGTQALVIAPPGGASTGGIAFGTSGIGLTTVAGATYGNVSNFGVGLNGWSGYDISKRYTFMSDISVGGATVGIHDNVHSWLWRSVAGTVYYDKFTQVYTNLPQQSYVSNQVLIGSNNNRIEWGVLYSTYYYAPNVNWRAGVLVATYFKASATSLLRVSGAASYYVSPGGMYYTQVKFYNVSTGTMTDIYLSQFTNNASNHVSFPIMAQTGSGLAAGDYQVYMYTNGITDGNDHLYILSEIVPS